MNQETLEYKPHIWKYDCDNDAHVKAWKEREERENCTQSTNSQLVTIIHILEEDPYGW